MQSVCECPLQSDGAECSQSSAGQELHSREDTYWSSNQARQSPYSLSEMRTADVHWDRSLPPTAAEEDYYQSNDRKPLIV